MRGLMLAIDAQEHLAKAVDGPGRLPGLGGERWKGMECPEEVVQGIDDEKGALHDGPTLPHECGSAYLP
jgi:hypothetical protein